jgi:hypothetical protein
MFVCGATVNAQVPLGFVARATLAALNRRAG